MGCAGRCQPVAACGDDKERDDQHSNSPALGLAALAALTAGRGISVLAPALVRFLEARWQLEMADEAGCKVMSRRLPGALPALWAQRRQARLLIPLLDQRRHHLAWEITALAASLVALAHGGMTLEGWVAVG